MAVLMSAKIAELNACVPKVGLGLIIVKDGKVLVGKRKGSHAAGLYSFPGGHLDANESWEDCAYRETKEECGEIKVKIRRFAPQRLEFFVTNDIMPEYQKHYITIFLVADWIAGEPENTEPEKCEGWEWVTYEQLKNCNCANWIPLELVDFYKKEIGIL